MDVLYLGLVTWLATLIIVEGKIFDTPRQWVVSYAPGKLSYLVTCHLCAGTWVGFALAAVAGGPFGGWAAIVLNGLLYKAIGHLVLEVVAVLKRWSF